VGRYALLLVVFCWLTLFHVLFIGAWVPRRKAFIPSQCPSCKYSLAGLGSAVCPECGGDCSNVKPDAETAIDIERPRGVMLTCRVLLVVIVAVPIWLLGFIVAAREYRSTHVTVRSPTGAWTDLTIRASASRSVGIDSQYSSSLRTDRVRAVVSGPTGTKRFRIADRWYRAVYETASGAWVRTSDAFEVYDLITWLQAAGVDVNKYDFMEEAEELRLTFLSVVVGGQSLSWTSLAPTWRLNLSATGGTYIIPSWTYSSVVLFASGLICFLSIRPLLRRRDLNPTPRDSAGS
jgi:hypothetical protein